MSKENNSSKGELTISRNHSLIIQKSDLVSRGLKLFYEIQNIQSDVIPAIQPRILIVEDDKATRSVLCGFFKKEGFKAYTASCSEEALEFLAKKSVDVVTTDNIHPGVSGLELTKIIKENYDTEVIIMTGYTEDCSHEDARTVGASDLLYKPFSCFDILNSVKKVLERRIPTSQVTEDDNRNKQKDLISHINIIAEEAMNILINKGVPYNEGLMSIIKDLEFHYQIEHGQFFSSIEDFKGIQFDIKIMCGTFRFSYDIGNRIFHYWARTFHKADNKTILDKDAKNEGIPLTSEDIVDELKKLLEEHDS